MAQSWIVLLFACLKIINVYSLLINKPPLIEQVLHYVSLDKLNGICVDDVYNISKWETDHIDVLLERHSIITEECVEMELTQQCYDDCIYYNDPESWILLLIENTTESLDKLTRMINYYSVSAGEYSYSDVGNPDMCLYYDGTYCSTPAGTPEYVFMRHGCCVPGSCVGQDAVKVLQSNPVCYQPFAAQYSFLITDICEPIARELSAGPIIVIFIFFIFVLLVFTASIFKEYGNNNVFISSFNIQDIYASFVKTRPLSQSQFNFLDGIRVWSMLWVIYGHSYIQWFYGNSSNASTFLPPVAGAPFMKGGGPENFEYLISYFYMIFVQYAWFAVDSFFWLTGFFGAFSIYRHTKKYGNKALSLCYLWIPLAYLSRILRISPMMMYTTAIEWQLADQLATGYGVTSRDAYTTKCDKNWYKIFLYYHNLEDDRGGCMVELWYIQCDMQLYLILPILLLIFQFKKSMGLLSALIAIIIGIIVRIYYAFYYDFSANELYPAYPTKNGGDQKWTYGVPWIRMCPFVVGILTMLIFIILDKKYKTFRLTKINYFFSLSLSLFIFSCLVLWPYQDVVNTPKQRWSLLSNQIYYSLSKVSWGVALSLLAFSFRYMMDTQKSIIKHFLSFTIYQPIAKLTYLMYLIHLVVLEWWLHDLQMPPYYTLWNQILLFLGAAIIVTFLSFILWIFMEKPLSNLSVRFIKFIAQKKINSNLNDEKIIKKSLEEAYDKTNYTNLDDAEQSMKYSMTQQTQTS